MNPGSLQQLLFEQWLNPNTRRNVKPAPKIEQSILSSLHLTITPLNYKGKQLEAYNLGGSAYVTYSQSSQDPQNDDLCSDKLCYDYLGSWPQVPHTLQQLLFQQWNSNNDKLVTYNVKLAPELQKRILATTRCLISPCDWVGAEVYAYHLQEQAYVTINVVGYSTAMRFDQLSAWPLPPALPAYSSSRQALLLHYWVHGTETVRDIKPSELVQAAILAEPEVQLIGSLDCKDWLGEVATAYNLDGIWYVKVEIAEVAGSVRYDLLGSW